MKNTGKFILGTLCALTLTACGGKTDKGENTDTIAVSEPFEARTGETKIEIKEGITPLVFVPVKGGTFEMGLADGQKHNDDISEAPAHKVTLSDYQICKIEVTQDQWETVMGKNPAQQNDDPQKPVENVSWNDTQAFVAKLSEMTGHKFRLPTEAEWEFAARGGVESKGTIYAGSDNPEDVLNSFEYGHGKTWVVGQIGANELGLFDMNGNVAEWVQDFYADYTAEEQTDPKGPATGEYHVYRGGHCNKNANECTVTIRMKFAPVMPAPSIGLRLVLVE